MHLFDSIASLFVRHTLLKNTTECPIQLEPQSVASTRNRSTTDLFLLTATIQPQGPLRVAAHSQNIMYSVFSAYCIGKYALVMTMSVGGPV